MHRFLNKRNTLTLKGKDWHEDTVVLMQKQISALFHCFINLCFYLYYYIMSFKLHFIISVVLKQEKMPIYLRKDSDYSNLWGITEQ